MGKRRKNAEQDILDRLEDLVADQYDRFERNVTYHKRGLDGELDGRAWHGNQFDYYEAKASLHPRAEGRAIRQFQRARIAFGKQLRYCYIVTPKAVYGPL